MQELKNGVQKKSVNGTQKIQDDKVEFLLFHGKSSIQDKTVCYCWYLLGVLPFLPLAKTQPLCFW